MKKKALVYPELFMNNASGIFNCLLLFDSIVLPHIMLEFEAFIGLRYQPKRWEKVEDVSSWFHKRLNELLDFEEKFSSATEVLVEEGIIEYYVRHPMLLFDESIKELITALNIYKPELTSYALSGFEKTYNFFRYITLYCHSSQTIPSSDQLNVLRENGMSTIDEYLRYLSYVGTFIEVAEECLKSEYIPLTNFMTHDYFLKNILFDALLTKQNLRNQERNATLLAVDVLNKKLPKLNITMDNCELILELRHKIKPYLNDFWVGVNKLAADNHFPEDQLELQDFFDKIIAKEIDPPFAELSNILNNPGRHIIKGILANSKTLFSGMFTFFASYQFTSSIPISAIASIFGSFFGGAISELTKIKDKKRNSLLTFVYEAEKSIAKTNQIIE